MTPASWVLALVKSPHSSLEARPSAISEPVVWYFITTVSKYGNCCPSLSTFQ